MANDFTGRTLKITGPGTIPLANFKVKGGLWTGTTATGQVFTIVDAAGRTYDITSYLADYPVVIPEWGWISGPAVITAMPAGEIALYLSAGK
jgi:hypothetical protein